MYVIAGATGHVGSVIARELLDQGHPVRAIVRDPEKAAALRAKGAELAQGSIEDAAFLTAALRGAEGAFVLLPPNLGVSDFRAYQRQLAGTFEEAVRESGVPVVAVLSSIGAEYDSGNGPIAGLHDLEVALRRTGARLEILRACYFQENTLSALGPARADGIFPSMLPPELPVLMVATRDIGMEAARVLAHPAPAGEIVDVLGPEYTAVAAAAVFGRVLGRPVRVVPVPPESQVDVLVDTGLSRGIAEVFAEMQGFFRKGLARPAGDRSVSGRTPLEETVRAAL